ncbi:MmgE/PrpD family protein [Microbacterium sp. RD1]|uniref:MmgE/PrpD family protein n=1 Tax=Microbacterium sp. RD1 TaxID=3457313 RepID=UPI003FA5A7D3
MSAPVVAELAGAAAGMRWAAMSEASRDRARVVFLDTVAGMVGGLRSTLHPRWRNVLGGTDGPATVFGSARPGAVADAVFFNATLPTVLQLDEGYRVSRGHPAIHVVPVALAVGEQLDRSLADVLTAVAAGYEVAARVGVAMGGTRAHIHPHGNWGAVGAAVTAAWLYADADAAAIGRAIDIAAGVAGMHDRRAAAEGAGMHHLWAATGAHTGLMAGAASAAGAEAVEGALVDFLLEHAGAAPDPALLTQGIRHGAFAPLAIDTGYIKFWAACGHTHTAIGAALEITGSAGAIDADRIADVEVRTFRAAASLDRTDARNALAARFSIPFTVAAALTTGVFTEESVDDAALDALRDVAARVRVIHDPSMDAGYPVEGRPLAMTVRLSNGKLLRADGLLSPGDPELPPTPDMLDAKAARLFERGREGRGADLVAEYRELDADTPVQTWTRTLRAGWNEGEDVER